jgi:hypothetical protein
VQLSILYVQKIDRDEKGAAALAAPVLLDVPVQRTLWTVGSAAPEASVRLRDNEITRDQQDALRQRALAEMLEVSSTAAAEQSESTLDHWRLAWAQQWQDENWRLSSSTVADRAACAAFEGPAGSMVVRLSAPPPTLAPERFIAALTAFCMACVLAWTFRRANEAEWLARFSPLVLAVAGVAWWIWLAPGELGWLLAAAGIWLSLGRPVRRTLPSQRSSVATLPVRR